MKFLIESTNNGERLDVYLATALPKYSRSILQKFIKDGNVLLNNAKAKSNAKVAEGDSITINLPQTPDFTKNFLPEIYKDENVIVINKPAGLLTHAKGEQSSEFTVGEYMRNKTSDGVDTNRPGIVHRLDRGTSGLIIAARTPTAKHWLQKQFATRKVKKTYVALVKGRPKLASATLQLPIERNPKKPQTFRVWASGKPAETTYETIKEYKNYTLLKLMPHTGRTHQLRVHMQYLGCPIVGDTLYGSEQPGLNRMFLHAKSLEITLPGGQRRVFTAPLPTELEDFLKTLQPK